MASPVLKLRNRRHQLIPRQLLPQLVDQVPGQHQQGIRADLLPAVADRAPSKQGKHLPGSHIPVISPEQLTAQAPDALLVLPWNLIDELRQQLPGYELVTAIPELQHWGGHN